MALRGCRAFGLVLRKVSAPIALSGAAMVLCLPPAAEAQDTPSSSPRFTPGMLMALLMLCRRGSCTISMRIGGSSLPVKTRRTRWLHLTDHALEAGDESCPVVPRSFGA